MRIGIAGFMGAGKTTCARAFVSERAEVIDADARAKAFMQESRAIKDGLRAAFGDGVIDKSGVLRFDVLGKLAFESAERLRLFNGVVHPPLVEHLKQLVQGCGKPVCILDAALLPLWESAALWFDLRVWVDVPFDKRYARLKNKLIGMDDAELVRRMRLQEEVMPVPKDDHWITLPDHECREYILGKLREADKKC